MLVVALAMRWANHDYLNSQNVRAGLSAAEETREILRKADQPARCGNFQGNDPFPAGGMDEMRADMRN